MAGEASQDTLRDTIAEQVDKLENTSEPAAPAQPAATPAEPAAAAPTAERPRDDQGRFVSQDKQEKPAEQGQQAKPALTAPAAVVAPAVPHPPRPSSWKKEYWDFWPKLDPKLAQYINQREGDYAKGVSTYKTEFDRARPLLDAVGQFAPEMQRMGVKPEQFISNLGNAHRTLALGTPEQKLSMFLKIAQDYQVPVHQLFIQGQDGRLYQNPNVQPWQPPAAQPQATQSQDVRSVVQDILLQEKAQQELAAFETQVEQKYPHYEVVKETMARLLDSGFSKTLESAYDTALRMPEHADLFAQAQQAKADAEKAALAEKARAEAERARRNTVSPRSSTPAVKSGDGKPRSIREHIESAFETHAPGDRV